MGLGRHVLAKGFGEGITEHEQIPDRFGDFGIVQPARREALRMLAGYRNRTVHFYHEVTAEELRRICADRLGDVERVRDALTAWYRAHPDRVSDAP